MSQLVERSLSTPEVRGSNPAISKKLCIECLLSTVSKIQKKRPGFANLKFLNNDKNKKICALKYLHGFAVIDGREGCISRISEAGVEAVTVNVVVSHRGLGRSTAVPRHWSR